MGQQAPDMTDTTVVDSVYRELDLGDTSRVTASLNLPKEGSRQSRITWKTSDQSVITDTGEIKRPGIGEKAASATLTATITKENVVGTKFLTSRYPLMRRQH